MSRRKGDLQIRRKGKTDRSVGAAKEAAYRMLSYRDRTSHEVSVKLREKGFPEAVVSAVISDLKEIDALNDARFARQWMQYQIENRHLGPFRLKGSLLEKGFSPLEVGKLLEGLSDDWDPVRLAERALLKRFKDPAVLVDLRLRRKAFAFLQRKGFGAGDILTVFRNIGVTG
ncbi:MAG: regulatory protein RecX [Nitrospiria bacterium]